MKKILYFISTLLALTFPIGAVAFTYVIQPGDTLSHLAAKNGTSVRALVDANGISDPNLIIAGKSLEIPEEELVGGSGGSYTPVTGYQSRLSVFLSASASTINVASTKDPAGNQIAISDVSSSSSARIYLDIAPGTSKEEIIYCTGVTATTWTGCVRGLSFQGGSMAASTTLAFAHNAGSSIVISNVGQFYTEYVSRTGNQDVYDIKTFYNYPKFAVTTTVPVLASEFATKYYVDNVGAGGFTASNVSTTRGLSVDGSVPEKVGINASTTRGLGFDSDGKLYGKASSTRALAYDSNGDLYFNDAANITFTGTNTFSGNVTTTGRFTVNTPTSTRDAANKGYVDAALSSASTTVQIFTSNGTWTKQTGANLVQVIAIGAGGGGGGGRSGANPDGGAGGGGGAYVSRVFNASDLTATVAVTVGTGGTGGAGGTAADGTSGTDGTASTFGAYLSAYGGGGGYKGYSAVSPAASGGSGGGSGGAGVTGSTSANTGGLPATTAGANGIAGQGGGGNVSGNPGGIGEYGGGSGGSITSGSGTTGGGSLFGGGGGGGSGTIGNPGSAGGAYGSYSSGGGGAAGGTAATGGAGTAGTAGDSTHGGSGGGAGGSTNTTTGTGGRGGDGGAVGGGGGGGGSGGSSSGTGGRGGDGGAGRVYVVTFF